VDTATGKSGSNAPTGGTPTGAQASPLANESNRDGRAPVSTGWVAAFKVVARLIFFRASQRDLIDLNHRHLTIGLVCTWLVGMGRYWDNPRVGLLQHLGVGSVIVYLVMVVVRFIDVRKERQRAGAATR